MIFLMLIRGLLGDGFGLDLRDFLLDHLQHVVVRLSCTIGIIGTISG